MVTATQVAVKLAPWEKVPWSIVKKVVVRLQSLIYRAAVENDPARVQAFQTRLLENAHARLLAVRRATEANQVEAALGVNALITSQARVALARTLKITDKGLPFCVTRRRRLGTCLQDVVRDRAKQMLARMALQPEWEARFEGNSFGYRPRRSYRDAIDAITFSLKGKEKHVLVADSCYIFKEMDHWAVMSKLRHSHPLLVSQVEAWLNGGIMDLRWLNPAFPRHGDFGFITPLLANIAMHGLESALREWAGENHPHEPAPLMVRFCEQFVVLSRSREFIVEATKFIRGWLLSVGIRLDPDRYTITDSTIGFEFLGFKFCHVWKREKLQLKVRPSKFSCRYFLFELKTVISQSRGGTCYSLIRRLAPKVERWGSFFKHCENRFVFRKMDWMIYQKLRPWVFRRRRHVGRAKAKMIHFPDNRIWIYQGKEHRSEWVLADRGTDRKKPVFLPQLRWMVHEWKPLKSVDEIMDNLDRCVLPDPRRRRRLVQLDTLLQLWSAENVLDLDDEGLEDLAQVMKLGNRELWKAVTDQDDGKYVYLYDNPVFRKIKEDISRKIELMFSEAEECRSSNNIGLLNTGDVTQQLGTSTRLLQLQP